MNVNEVVCGDALEILPKLRDVQLLYIDPPFMTQRDFGAYSDKWSGDSYTDWLSEIIEESRAILRPSGTFILHLDWRSVHKAKLHCDEIFGVDNFINEIIWCYQSGGASRQSFARKHDTLLMYGKGPERKFNVQREPYPRDYGGRAGFHPEGRMMNDWWQISILSTTSIERVYPTQKPIQLLERIVLATTDPGDIVADVCCGSGTTGVAAKSHGRSYLLSDINPEAVEIAKKRLL